MTDLWNGRGEQSVLQRADAARERCTAVLLAAGKGLRMGGNTRKQYLDMEGRPLFTYSLETMSSCDFITDIVITVLKGDEDLCLEMVRKYGLEGKVRRVIAGGSERCFSVHRGLQTVDWPCDYAFIHDAARMFIDKDSLERLYEAVRKYKACVAAVPSKDTVKIADAEGFVARTPNRKDVWIVQTPQVFAFEMIRDAYAEMDATYDDLCEKGVIVTDDAMVVEYFTGCKVKLVEASYRNIKVTTPEDLVLASAFLKEKE